MRSAVNKVFSFNSIHDSHLVRFILYFLLSIVASPLLAQYSNPHVKWEFSSKKTSEDEFDLVATANMEKGFHLYSQYIGEGGPIPTSFTFEKSDDYKITGKVKESGNRKEALEPLFDNMKLIWFEDEGRFTQRVKILKPSATIKGSVNFMTCNDQLCDPPSDQSFEYVLSATPATDEIKSNTGEATDSSAAQVLVKSEDSIRNVDSTKLEPAQVPDKNKVTIPQESPAGDVSDVRYMSYWQTFVAGFGYGLIALLMPCVWPVIPLTISFFLKQNKEHKKGRINAVIYGFSILLIFVIMGVAVSLFTNEQKLNELSTGWFFNLVFFALFFLFGLSFLGVFEIRVPSRLINRTEALSDQGGLIGIFFMAFTLVLVSFSCTLPFVANLISIVSRDGEFAKPLIGFAAFGLAIGLPFGLFAWFPSGLKKLPKSGGWMNAIKVSFGFIELALSFMYLSKVDMAYHWGLLSRDIFLSMWIMIFAVLGLYLLGKIRLEHDGLPSHIGVPRLLFALISLSFALYMVPGLWGAPLKPLSGFLPTYSEFMLTPTLTAVPENKLQKTDDEPKKYADLFDAPLGLDLYFDYDQALSRAKELKKPLFVDFTGWGCVNCRKMEKSVWPDPEVLKRLKNDYVTVSLYVDDKYKLPADEQYFSVALNKEVITLGDRNFDLQYSKYSIGAQPYYVLLDDEGVLLNQPRGYTSDVITYVNFLDEGIKQYQSRQN
nr:thioredoxin family protein [Chitinophagales bacterium]